MSQKLIQSYTQFLDGNGDPLSGGKLVFSVSGTDTPKTVYSGENETGSLGNEVDLDASGRPTSGGAAVEIYSALTGAYRLKVLNASSVTLVTTEDLQALNQFSALTMTGQLLLDDSTSTSTPVLGFDTDPDTGIARPAADVLALVTGGAERGRVNSSGNFGLGTTSPAERLDVAGGFRATGEHYSQSGTFTVTAAGTTTELIENLSDGVYLVSFACSGTNMELMLTGIVHVRVNLVSQVTELLSSDFNLGSVLLQPQDNATPWTFDTSRDQSFQFVCTGDGTSDQTANWRLLRLGSF